jgi:ribosomal-protein-alanine N-acetyltransferase
MNDNEPMRVTIREPRPADAAAYAEAVIRSAEHIGRWNPVDPDGFHELLRQQGLGLRTFMIIDGESGGIVGKCNVANIARGRFRNATLGYDSYLPYSGTGRMSEGMRLVVDRCFADTRDGLALHRLEINVQPENERSIALAKRLGFRHEGFSPRFLFLNDAWRDHERFALTVEDWPGL